MYSPRGCRPCRLACCAGAPSLCSRRRTRRRTQGLRAQPPAACRGSPGPGLQAQATSARSPSTRVLAGWQGQKGAEPRAHLEFEVRGLVGALAPDKQTWQRGQRDGMSATSNPGRSYGPTGAGARRTRVGSAITCCLRQRNELGQRHARLPHVGDRPSLVRRKTLRRLPPQFQQNLGKQAHVPSCRQRRRSGVRRSPDTGCSMRFAPFIHVPPHPTSATPLSKTARDRWQGR